MSPRWNRSVRLHVGADAVKATARVGWPRAVAIAEVDRAVATDPSSGSELAAHAQAIDAALAELASSASSAGGRLEVDIASSLLHIDVVEGDFGAQADRQLHGIAVACVSEMLGDEAAGRAVRWHLQRDERHLLIVALAEAWIDLLQSAATTAGLRLASVEPTFLARWNESGKAMKAGHGVFAVCASGDLAIAAVSDGAIAAVSVGAGVDLRVDPPGPRVQDRSGAVVASGFSSDSRGMATVDERVDRFLSARGQDPGKQSAFILVAPESMQVAASTRWSVIASRELRP